MKDKKETEETLKIFKEAIENNNPVVLIARGESSSVAMMGGDELKEIVGMLITALDQDRRLRTPFKLALITSTH